MFYSKQWEKKKKVIGEKAYYKRYSENTLKENFILKEDETFHQISLWEYGHFKSWNRGIKTDFPKSYQSSWESPRIKLIP